MSKKVIILITVFFTTTISCMTQFSSEAHSKNEEANNCYSKALYYINIGNPRNGGSVDSLLIAVQ